MHRTAKFDDEELYERCGFIYRRERRIKNRK